MDNTVDVTPTKKFVSFKNPAFLASVAAGAILGGVLLAKLGVFEKASEVVETVTES